MPLHAAVRLDAGPDVYASEDRKEGARAYLEKRAAAVGGAVVGGRPCMPHGPASPPHDTFSSQLRGSQ